MSRFQSYGPGRQPSGTPGNRPSDFYSPPPRAGNNTPVSSYFGNGGTPGYQGFGAGNNASNPSGLGSGAAGLNANDGVGGFQSALNGTAQNYPGRALYTEGGGYPLTGAPLGGQSTNGGGSFGPPDQYSGSLGPNGQYYGENGEGLSGLAGYEQIMQATGLTGPPAQSYGGGNGGNSGTGGGYAVQSGQGPNGNGGGNGGTVSLEEYNRTIQDAYDRMMRGENVGRVFGRDLNWDRMYGQGIFARNNGDEIARRYNIRMGGDAQKSAAGSQPGGASQLGAAMQSGTGSPPAPQQMDASGQGQQPVVRPQTLSRPASMSARYQESAGGQSQLGAAMGSGTGSQPSPQQMGLPDAVDPYATVLPESLAASGYQPGNTSIPQSQPAAPAALDPQRFGRLPVDQLQKIASGQGSRLRPELQDRAALMANDELAKRGAAGNQVAAGNQQAAAPGSFGQGLLDGAGWLAPDWMQSGAKAIGQDALAGRFAPDPAVAMDPESMMRESVDQFRAQNGPGDLLDRNVSWGMPGDTAAPQQGGPSYPGDTAAPQQDDPLYAGALARNGYWQTPPEQAGLSYPDALGRNGYWGMPGDTAAPQEGGPSYPTGPLGLPRRPFPTQSPAPNPMQLGPGAFPQDPVSEMPGYVSPRTGNGGGTQSYPSGGGRPIWGSQPQQSPYAGQPFESPVSPSAPFGTPMRVDPNRQPQGSMATGPDGNPYGGTPNLRPPGSPGTIPGNGPTGNPPFGNPTQVSPGVKPPSDGPFSSAPAFDPNMITPERRQQMLDWETQYGTNRSGVPNGGYGNDVIQRDGPPGSPAVGQQPPPREPRPVNGLRDQLAELERKLAGVTTRGDSTNAETIWQQGEQYRNMLAKIKQRVEREQRPIYYGQPNLN